MISVHLSVVGGEQDNSVVPLTPLFYGFDDGADQIVDERHASAVVGLDLLGFCVAALDNGVL